MSVNIFCAVLNIEGALDLSNVDCLELIWNNDQKSSDCVIINTKPLVGFIAIVYL